MPETGIDTDRGYQEIVNVHANAAPPQKKPKENPPDKAGKAINRAVSRKRVVKERALGCVKGFRIVSDTYGKRRKRFGPRFNLSAALYHLNLVS
jgi:hypothetical protein